MKKFFTPPTLLALLCSAMSLTANAQYSAEVEEYPVGYSTKAVTFPITEVAATLGADAATLGSTLKSWVDAEAEQPVYYLLLGDQQPSSEPEALNADYYTQGGRGGFWMSKESTIVTWSGDGANGDAWYDVFDVDLDEGNLVFEIGQHPDAFAAGEQATAHFILSYEGRQATFDITLKVVEKPLVEIPEAVTALAELTIVGEQTVKLHQQAALSWGADACVANLEGVADLLGATDEAIASELPALLYATQLDETDETAAETSIFPDLTNQSTAAEPGFWFKQLFGEVEKDGEVTMGGKPEVAAAPYASEDAFYAESFAYDADTKLLTCNLGQMPNKFAAGDSLVANIYIVWGSKAYHIAYNLLIDEREVQTIDDMEQVGSTDITVEFEVGDTYTGSDTVIDVETIAQALGVEASEISVLAMSAEGLTTNSTAHNGGYWLSEEGQVVVYGAGSLFYIEPATAGDWNSCHVGQYPNQLTAETDYAFTIYFVAGVKYYAVNFTIHTLAAQEEPVGEEVPQSEFHSVATKAVNIQVVPADAYTVDMHYTYDAQEVADLLGTASPTLFALAVPSEDTEAEPYTRDYTCTPYPGFWMNRDGYVTTWSSSESPWGVTFEVNSGELTFYQYPGFADNVVGKVYKAPFYLVNTQTGAMVTFDVTLRFVSEVVEVETVGQEDLVLPVDASKIVYTSVDMSKAVEALGVESLDVLLSDRQALVYNLANGTQSDGSDPYEGVMLNEKGFLDETDGNVETKVYLQLESDDESHAIFSTENPSGDFASGDVVTATVGLRSGNQCYLFNITFVDPDAYQSVATLKTHSAEAPVFDLSGRRVSRPAQPGIYIQAGRKVAVK